MLTAAIGYFLEKDMNSISTVEGEGFKKIVQAFDKRYALPSRHHFSRMILPNVPTISRRSQESSV